METVKLINILLTCDKVIFACFFRYMKIHRKCLMWALFNAHILQDSHTAVKREMNTFSMEVAHELVSDFSARKDRGPRLRANPDGRLCSSMYRPVVLAGSYEHRCAVCVTKYREFTRQNPGQVNPYKKSRSIFGCASPSCAGINLCIKEESTCWYNWHYVKEYWR